LLQLVQLDLEVRFGDLAGVALISQFEGAKR